MSERFAGKNVLVTGGSSGIGKSAVIHFAREGASVACVASADRHKADEVVAEAGAVPGRILSYAADVSDWDQAKRLVGEVVEQQGGIDILVTAAGVFKPTPIDQPIRSETELTVAVNLVGTLATINAVVPHMSARGSGKIVCVASIAGLVGIRGYAAYCATKAGIVGLVKALAIELAPLGININAIAPGNTETPLNEDIRTKPELRHVYDRMASRTPSRRVYSKPEDMARAALYLASEDAVAMYGSTLVLDEGIIAGL